MSSKIETECVTSPHSDALILVNAAADSPQNTRKEQKTRDPWHGLFLRVFVSSCEICFAGEMPTLLNLNPF